MKYWKKIAPAEQDRRITEALAQNIDYTSRICLGIPASRLDGNVFNDQAPFLKDAPLLRSYVQNPNHIGCHTLGSSEPFFKGTQEIEKDVIELLAVDMLKAEVNSCDGYVASGGTEANIQAAWIYRNYFRKAYGATQKEIALMGSEDTHYSIAKAANLLNVNWFSVPVDPTTRKIESDALQRTVNAAKLANIRYFIVIANLGSTMFGSIDDPDQYAAVLRESGVEFKIHVDGAFGGFIIPTSQPLFNANFANSNVSSITLDAHKMLQAPYGTGIFIVRKGLMDYVYTKEAQYVSGMDLTVSGSRSGANAIAVWMILATYGPFGWLEKINKLIYRTNWFCSELDRLHIRYFRDPAMNIVALMADQVQAGLVEKYGLVPDDHSQNPTWFKIVVMDHVELDHLQQFITDLSRTLH